MNGSENEFINLWELTDGINKTNPKNQKKMITLLIIAEAIVCIWLTYKITKNIKLTKQLFKRVKQFNFYNLKGKVITNE